MDRSKICWSPGNEINQPPTLTYFLPQFCSTQGFTMSKVAHANEMNYFD